MRHKVKQTLLFWQELALEPVKDLLGIRHSLDDKPGLSLRLWLFHVVFENDPAALLHFRKDCMDAGSFGCAAKVRCGIRIFFRQGKQNQVLLLCRSSGLFEGRWKVGCNEPNEPLALLAESLRCGRPQYFAPRRKIVIGNPTGQLQHLGRECRPGIEDVADRFQFLNGGRSGKRNDDAGKEFCAERNQSAAPRNCLCLKMRWDEIGERSVQGDGKSDIDKKLNHLLICSFVMPGRSFANESPPALLDFHT